MDTRLTKLQWLDQGLKTLEDSGPGMLKAVQLAKTLGVTRGSFYWHFSDVDDFHQQLLDHWKESATDSVMEFVDNSSDKSERLQILLTMAMGEDQKLERSIRSWAVENERTAEVLNRVDKVRMEYIEKILPLPQPGQPDNKSIAKFIYWAYLGRIMMGEGNSDFDGMAIKQIADIFQAPNPICNNDELI